MDFHRRSAPPALALALLAAGCGAGAPGPAEEVVEDASSHAEHARQLAHEVLILDTHIDVPYRLLEKMEDISVATEAGQFDHPRAVAGGLDAAFMSIYVPASYQETGGAREHADGLIDMVEGFEEQWPEKFAVARSVADVERLRAEGRLALPMGMENGAPIEDDLANVRHFAERGIRYVTLTHSENNLICDSSYAAERTWNGLSPFGAEVVAEMNRLGVMVDISHVSDDAFYQVLEITTAPVIASHSSARAFTPGFERNMDDAMIAALAENGGVIQINFGSAFLTQTANEQSMAMWKAIGDWAEERGLANNAPEVEEFAERYRAEHGFDLATIADVADHIDHVVEIAGIDHVGLGSDFDGVGPTTPIGLEDVSKYPNLIAELLARGYGDEDVEKIAGGNLLRVWREVERVAARPAE